MAKILVTYQHRPMCVGLFYRRALEQLGHEVVSAGPGENQVYGHSGWEEYMAPTVELPNEPIEVSDVIDRVRAAHHGWTPDALIEIDQYDFLYLTGQSRVPWAHVAVENFNHEQWQRAQLRQGAAEYYMIQHDSNGQCPPPPLPIGAEWMVFGADQEIHPLLTPIESREKWICQIGTHYEPRPTIWNYLRDALDGAPPMPNESYGRNLHESPRTSFGKIFSYDGMAKAYNSAICALSFSHVDFIPMRASEAFAMGCVFVSDDVPSLRAAFGAPWPENPDGIWITHDRTAQGMADVIRRMATENRQFAIEIAQRAYNCVTEKHLYRHEAARILTRLGVA